MRALISVYDKTGLDGLRARARRARRRARRERRHGRAPRRAAGSTSSRVEELTEVPELLGGRVKTLHPRDPRGDPRAPRPRRRPRGAATSTRSSRSTSSASTSTRSRPSPRASGSREEEAVEMIDVGGPSMLRAAAKNFAHVAPALPARAVRTACSPSCASSGRALGRDAPRARGRGVRHDGRLRGGDRALVRRPRGLPADAHARLREGARPRVRREPAPARGLLRRARRAPAPALDGRAARCTGSRSRSTTSTTSRRRACWCASSRCRPA